MLRHQSAAPDPLEGPRGERELHSDWAIAITSAAMARSGACRDGPAGPSARAELGLRGGDSSPGIRNVREATRSGTRGVQSAHFPWSGRQRETRDGPWRCRYGWRKRRRVRCAVRRPAVVSGLPFPVVYTGRRLPSGAGLGNWSCCFGRPHGRVEGTSDLHQAWSLGPASSVPLVTFDFTFHR